MRVGILTVSDRRSRGEGPDEGGPAIREALSPLKPEIVKYQIVPDDKETIAQVLREWSDTLGLELVFTTGGTGLSPRDFTPEATLSVVERLAPGFGEVMRAAGLRHTPHALLSRAVAGIRGKTLIVNLPGNPQGVKQCLEALLPALPHAVETLTSQATE